MIEKVVSFIEKKGIIIFLSSLCICVIFAFLLFNLKISDGGDDSDYIVEAFKFLKGISFPSGHSSFYPIFLSIFVWIFGIKLFLLKLLSLICIVFHLYFFYQTFKNKIPEYILLLTVSFICINSFILIYASLSYSEALYFALQISSLYYFFKIADNLNMGILPLKLWKYWLVFGFLMFVLFNTRNIGITFLLSIAIYFLFYKKWGSAIIGIISFLVYQIPFSLYQKIVWGSSNIFVTGSYGGMFLKNSYQAGLGKETFWGFVERFFENINQFISTHLLIFFGLRPETSYASNIFLTITCFAIFYFIIKSIIQINKYLNFVCIYITSAMCVTFLVQQTNLDQGRLILVFVPLIFLVFISGLNEIFIKKRNILLQAIPISVGLLMIIISFVNTISKAAENIPVLSENISGDKYYGFTQDWINYLKLSTWCADNLPKDAIIGCRKPTMSFIYGNGKDFRGIYQCPFFPVDSFLRAAKKMPAILVIREDEIRSKLSRENQLILRKNFWAIIMKNNIGFGIIPLNSFNKNYLISKVAQFRIFHSFSYDTLGYFTKYSKSVVAYPDSLLNIFHSMKLEYIIDAKINGGAFDGNKQFFINTVKRYISLIAQKYPSLFELVRVEGKTYPASLYKIHWEMVVPNNEN